HFRSKNPVVLFYSVLLTNILRHEEYNWVFAAEMADSIGADVINSSIGYRDFDDPTMDYDFEELDGVTSVISRASDLAASKGMIPVTSSGNTSSNLTLPADAFNILSVGGINRSGEKTILSAFFDSSDGRTKPEVVALGNRVTTINSSGEIDQSSGTSFASPLVAGLALGVWQNYPNDNNRQIIDRIIRSGSQFEDVTDLLGYGIPNYLRIVGRQVTGSDEPDILKSFNIYPNPSETGIFQIAIPENTVDFFTVTVRDMAGKQLFSTTYKDGDTLTLDLSAYVPSAYVVTIVNDDETFTRRLIRK
ncbi:MAG: S8 family serine peptidase, partial [Bacteroidota bacterium]